MGRTGVASRFSIVPRSRSRVMASEVMITMVMVSIVPTRPGTMLYCVIPSQLQHSLTVGGGCNNLADAEVAAVFHRPNEAARKNAFVGGEHRGGQRPGV